MRFLRILLVIVAVVCFGVALSYPLRYRQAEESNNTKMETLAEMRQRVRQEQSDAPVVPVSVASEEAGDDADAVPDPWADDAPGDEPVTAQRPAGTAPAEGTVPDGGTAPTEGTAPVEGSAPGDESANPPADGEGRASTGDQPAEQPGDGPEFTPAPTPVPTPSPTPTLEPDYWDLSKRLGATPTPTPRPVKETPTPTPVPTPTPDWSIRTGALPYDMKEKVVLDEAAILPELREIYELNHDLVGWITIPDTVIDYPVVQCDNSEFYLTHDFEGEENINGQIILDTPCDPYTPSYNLIISGHHMKNGSMFGDLPEYRNKNYWEKHKLIEFDSLMFRKQYVVFACFYSADYDEDEEGFRYNADIQYNMEAKKWLREIEINKLYNTEIDVQFGDEFITLTTCNRARHRNGRFVVVARKVREGETIQ